MEGNQSNIPSISFKAANWDLIIQATAGGWFQSGDINKYHFEDVVACSFQSPNPTVTAASALSYTEKIQTLIFAISHWQQCQSYSSTKKNNELLLCDKKMGLHIWDNPHWGN